MNKSLTAKQIIARATLNNGLLRILLLSAQPLNQQEMLEVVRKGITSLQPAHVNEVEVIGQKSNTKQADWSSRFILTPSSSQNPKSGKQETSSSSQPSQQIKNSKTTKSKEPKQVNPPQSSTTKPKPKNIRLILLTTLIGLGLASGVGSLLWLRHNQAQLIDQILATVPPDDQANEPSDIQQMVSDREQLQGAITRLETVPRFPGSLYPTAQENINQLQVRLSQLEQSVNDRSSQNWQDAQKLAQQASTLLAASRPNSTTLRNARTHLEQAIVLVEPIPQDATPYTPAHTALTTYQEQLKSLDSRLAVEDKAAQEYSAALNLAMEVSKLTQGGTHPADLWSQAVAKWQEAVNHLEAIPTGTSVSVNAQGRLSTYRSNLASVQTRLSAEQKAVNDFNTAKQLATEAVSLTQSPPVPSSTWQTAAQKWQQAINLLKGIPTGTTVSQGASSKVPQYQTNLRTVNANLQRQLVAEALERLRPEIQSVVDQFSALDSSLDVGMNYTLYSQEVRDLKVSLDRLSRQQGVSSLAVYQSLNKAFQAYDLALSVWQYYIESDETHNFIPASFPYGSLLINYYGVSTTDIVGTRYIYLNDALSQVWLRAGNHVTTAQGQI